MAHRVVLVPSDGVGPEVVEAARSAVDATGAGIDWDLRQAGQGARSQAGTPLPQETVNAIRDARVALKGAHDLQGAGSGIGRQRVATHLRPPAERSTSGMVGAQGVRLGVDLVLACMTETDLYSGAAIQTGSDRARALAQLVLESGLDPDHAGLSIKFMTRLGAEGVAAPGSHG